MSMPISHLSGRMFGGRRPRKRGRHGGAIPKRKNAAHEENISPDLIEPLKVFVTNIPHWVNHHELNACFEKLVVIKHINIIQGKGFGFITLNSEEDTQRLLEFNGTVFTMRRKRVKLFIKPAKKLVKRPGMAGYTRVPLSEREFDLEPIDPDHLSIHILFDELIYKIFDFLDVKTIICCEQVCRRWQELVYTYFEKAHKSNIENDMANWFMENKLKFSPSSFSKVLVFCGSGLKKLEVNGSRFHEKSNPLSIIGQLCPSLEELTLKNFEKPNFFKRFDSFIESVSRLQAITIEDTSFKDEHLTLLFQSTTPRKLSLKGVSLDCKISLIFLPDSIIELSLEDFSLGDPDVSQIVERCPSLEFLVLSGLCITHKSLKLLSKCENLVKLNLSIDAVISYSDYYGKEDQENLTLSFPRLKVLSVTGHFPLPISSTFIEGAPNVEELNLSSCDLDEGPVGGFKFSTLKDLRNLVLPSYSFNDRLNPDAVESLLQCEKLETLDLGAIYQLNFILKCIEQLPSLKVLTCIRYELDESDIAKFKLANKKKSHILTINLQMTDYGFLNNADLQKANLIFIHRGPSNIYSVYGDDMNGLMFNLDEALHVSDFEYDDYESDNDYFMNFYEDMIMYLDNDDDLLEAGPEMYLEFGDYL